jgi:excisionase family DNA binding protein
MVIKLLSLDQAAAYPGTNVSRESLLYQIHAGRLRATRVGRRIWVIELADLVAFNKGHIPNKRYLNRHRFFPKETE